MIHVGMILPEKSEKSSIHIYREYFHHLTDQNLYNFFVTERNCIKVTILKHVPCDVSRDHEILLTKHKIVVSLG
jgi:hypothetical protein